MQENMLSSCLLPPWQRAAYMCIALVVLTVTPWMGVSIGCSMVWDVLWKMGWRSLPGKRLWTEIERLSRSWASRLLVNEQDALLLPIILPLIIYPTIISAACVYIQYAVLKGVWSYGLMLLFHVLRMGPYFRFFAHAATLIHKEGHFRRGLFKVRFLNRILEWYVGFFYGHVPESYRVNHVKLHHRFDNQYDDVTTTLPFDRSDPVNFVYYLGEFVLYWTGISCVAHFLRRRDTANAVQVGVGMAWYYCLGLGLVALDWRFGLGYYFLPHFETMVYLSAMNYVWHAFVDPNDPNNEYISSLTVLNGQYPVLNEDYHVVHHLHPSMHWTEMNKEYERTTDEYAKNQATMFSDTHEFELFAWLVTRRFDLLAAHFVDLNGKLTYDDKLALIMHRLQPVPPPTGHTLTWRG